MHTSCRLDELPPLERIGAFLHSLIGGADCRRSLGRGPGESAKAWAEDQAQRRAVAEKTERLRALRLAKEAAETVGKRKTDA